MCQLRADLADMSAERDASTDKQEQRAQELQQRVAELEAQLESAASPGDEDVFDMEPDASIEEVQVCLAPGTLEVLCVASTSKAIPKMATWACDAGTCTTLHAHDDRRGGIEIWQLCCIPWSQRLTCWYTGVFVAGGVQGESEP